MANIVDTDVNALLGTSRPRGYKAFFMLNSAEHEILNAYKLLGELPTIHLTAL